MEKANIGLLEGPSTLEKHIQITDKHSFMQLAYIQRSEECCCVRHSQCCHWSSQHSALLQVGVMGCVDVVAAAMII